MVAASVPPQRPISEITDRAKRARIGWRRFDSAAVETPSRLFVNVRDGKVVSFGVEPVGDAIVALDGTVSAAVDGARGRIDRMRVTLAGAAAAAGAAVLGAAAAAVAHRRRARAA